MESFQFPEIGGKRVVKAGAFLSLLAFAVIVHGMLIYRFDFKVIRQEVYLENLPASFENFTVAQISDLHLAHGQNQAC